MNFELSPEQREGRPVGQVERRLVRRPASRHRALRPLTIPPVLIGLWIWSSEFQWAARIFASAWSG